MNKFRLLNGILRVNAYNRFTTYILDICSYLRYKFALLEYRQNENNCNSNNDTYIVVGGDLS